MSTDFPKYTRSARLGEQGVSIVTGIVSDAFGWLFKRNHQEHDFGIDGQIEIVTEDGMVTGQILSAQIKCGKSFLRETNQWGYIYRGEHKHLSYLCNYPIPVLIIICDPEKRHCYWEHFKLERAEPTPSGWKITIPFQNHFDKSKDLLTSLVKPVRDGYSELRRYWDLNKILYDSSIILYAFDKKDIEEQEVVRPRAFFDRLRSTREIALESQGKVEFAFSDYDNDPRALYEIPEVRRYVALLDAALPEIFFFIRNEEPTHTLNIFALCQTKIRILKRKKSNKIIEVDTYPLAKFIERHCLALNELTEWVNMTREDEERLFNSVLRCLKIGV
ncbi:DUF4365 and DUF1817 domain-containing protein [Gluconobacter cerinus]